MMTSVSFVRGATPTIAVTVDHDLTGLDVFVALKGSLEYGGTGEYIEREVQPKATDGGCTLTLTLTQEESLALSPGGAVVEVKAYDSTSGSVVASGHATIDVEPTIIGHTLPE